MITQSISQGEEPLDKRRDHEINLNVKTGIQFDLEHA